MKIFRLLPLSIHNISLYKARFESHIRLNSYRARYKVVQGTSRIRYTNNNGNTEIRVKQINNASLITIITIILLTQIIIIIIIIIVIIMTIKLTATVII